MNIQSAIDRHGTTKAELARKMEVAPSYITQLVSGQSSPSMKMLDKLADLIGCKRWEFFLDEIKSDPHGVERFIDEMDRDEVARILGLTAHTAPQPAAAPADVQPSAPAAPQPAAEPRKEEHSDAGASELPFKNDQPSVPASLICPHCGGAFVVEVRAK